MKKALYMPVLLMGALLFHNASAEMYKWTDKTGETHYTETPPPPDVTGKDIEADIKLSAGKASDKTTPPDAALKPEEKAAPDKPEDKRTDEEKAKASEKEHHDYCNSQKTALIQLKTNSLVKWRDENGEHFLTADEKSKKIEELNKNIDSMCGSQMFSSQSGPANKEDSGTKK
jgi:hypothetical protein